MRPSLLVIAGPNGAGKTTVTTRLREERWSEGVEYLNPDDVARERFGDWNSPAAVLDAARWTEARREELLAARASVAFETVLSSEGKIERRRRLQTSRADGEELRARRAHPRLPQLGGVIGRITHLPSSIFSAKSRFFAYGGRRSAEPLMRL